MRNRMENKVFYFYFIIFFAKKDFGVSGVAIDGRIHSFVETLQGYHSWVWSFHSLHYIYKPYKLGIFPHLQYFRVSVVQIYLS